INVLHEKYYISIYYSAKYRNKLYGNINNEKKLSEFFYLDELSTTAKHGNFYVL
ncbi:hypothetical protein ACJX0J_039995, partial [Zea mays]